LVSHCPDIRKVASCLHLIQRHDAVPQPVESIAKRAPPGLVPARFSSGMTTTIASPPLDPVSTAPGGVFKDFGDVSRRILFEILAISGQAGELVLLNVVKRIG